jgi:ElaB/YqjD/DUF883 family membrane-anchored ribosome-binding protein
MRTEKTLGDTAAEEGNADMNESTEKLAELRERLSTAIESAKAAAKRLEERTVAAAKATDECIREHPYQTLGLALGLGVLVGFLIGRRRD